MVRAHFCDEVFEDWTHSSNSVASEAPTICSSPLFGVGLDGGKLWRYRLPVPGALGILSSQQLSIDSLFDHEHAIICQCPCRERSETDQGPDAKPLIFAGVKA